VRTLFLHIAVAAAAVPLPLNLVAQTVAERDTLLARLTAEAIAANSSLRAARAVARAARARLRPAGALPDPVLSVGVMNLTLPRFAFRESDFTEVDVELSQEFPWPGTLAARTAQARAEATARGADLASRQRETVVRTAELYYRLRYVVTARATLVQQRALLSTAVEISTTRYASTSAPQSDPLQARVALARLDTEDADLAAEEAAFRAELDALRNVSGSGALVVEPLRPPDVLPIAAHEAVYADSGAGPELLHHPRLASRRATVEASELAARVERLGARPDFTVSTRYGARPLGADFFSAFVGVRVPLFARRKQLRLADAAQAEADAAQAGLEEERATLASELRRVIAQVRAGYARLRLLVERVVPAAAAAAEATLRNYRVGRVEFLAVLAAEDALYRAELDVARVAAEHRIRLVVLEQLLRREDTP
jgi:cobalt-zinc-cadmium efflux system outer membrane protein